MLKSISVLLTALLLAPLAAPNAVWGGLHAAEPISLPLWETSPPGLVANAAPETTQNGITTFNVSVPGMKVYLPKKGNGMAVVYCSGGSYRSVSHLSDAVGNAEFFDSQGIALIVVKYRTQPPSRGYDAALMDARRAMRLTRHHAPEWGVDPARIGMLGGSAGAHLILRVATGEHGGQPEAQDPVERESCRPAFAGLLCPWPGTNKAGDFSITNETPPMFLCSARDDTVAPTAFAEGIARACEKVGTQSRLWIIEKGGHRSFRLGVQGEGAQWAGRFTEWLKSLPFSQFQTSANKP